MRRQDARVVPPIRIRPREAQPVLATQVLLLHRMVDVRSNAAPAIQDPTEARVPDVYLANTKQQLEQRYARIVLVIHFRPPPVWPFLHVFATLAIPDPTVAHVPLVRPGITKLLLEVHCARNVGRENTLVQRLPLQRRHVPAVRIFLAVRVLHVLHLWVVLATPATPEPMRARAPDVSRENTKMYRERRYAALVPRIQIRPSTTRHLLPAFATLATPEPTVAHVRHASPENTKLLLERRHARLARQDRILQVLVLRRVSIVRRTPVLRALDVRRSAAASATWALRGQTATVQRVMPGNTKL